MAKLFTPAHRTLTSPGTDRRVLRLPDLRATHSPRLSGAPIADERDYDELIIHRSYRVYEDEAGSNGAEVKYFVFEYSQRNPGEDEWFTGVKVVRLLRLTRVPRYLRGGSSGDVNLVFEQQRDVLAALREEQVLFLNLVAHSPDMPLAFCYGTQAVASTFEAAAERADESFEVLRFQLHGTYQQLQTAPLTMDEGEKIAQYQSEWDHIAMSRGRPLPAGGTMPMSGIDGNRTDVSSANNQLEAFLRGMSDQNFLLTLVTVPLSPAEMSLAWRNLGQKLSDVRSDQQGMRAINAGVALPLTLGMAMGESHGDTSSTSQARGVGDSYGVSQAITDSHSVGASQGVSSTQTDGESRTVGASVSESQSVGVSQTLTDGVSASVTEGQSLTASEGVSENTAVGLTQGQSFGLSESDSMSFTEGQGRSVGMSESLAHTQSASESVSRTQGATESVTATEGISRGTSVGESASVGQSASITEGQSVSESASLGRSVSEGANWSSSLGDSFNASVSQMEGWSQSLSEQLSQSLSMSDTSGDGVTGTESQARNSQVNGGLFGFSGANGFTEGNSFAQNLTNSDTFGLGLTSGMTGTDGVNSSRTEGLTQGVTRGESLGGSVTATDSASNSVGQSSSLSATEGVSQTAGRSVSESFGATQSLAQGLAVSNSMTQGGSVGESLSRGLGTSETLSNQQSLSQGRTLGSSAGVTEAVSQSQGAGRTAGLSSGATTAATLGQSSSVAQGQSAAATAGVSQSESAGVSRSVSQGASQSASESVGRSHMAGENAGVASNQTMSDAYMVAMSRTASSTGSLGAVPNVGVTISRQTFDESKRLLGDVLESQLHRYIEGVKSGAFLYQLFLVTPDKTTLRGGAALLKSAFWSAGTDNISVAQPFHTVVDFEDDERQRLLAHARCFTSYRKREPVVEEISPFRYSSYITPSEMAALTHPPTANSLGLESQFDSMPVLAMPANRQGNDLYLGHVVNGERAEISHTRFGLEIEEVTHMLVTGVTGSGKALALDTPIATPQGWTTMGELAVGDEIFGADGQVARVTFATNEMLDHRCYRVKFSDGTSIVADGEHLWEASSYHSRFNDRRSQARREGGGTSNNNALVKAAKRARLVSHTHQGEHATLARLAALLNVPEARVRHAVKHTEPSGTSRIHFEQSYGDTLVRKSRTLDTYDIFQVATRVAESLEARAVAAGRMPLTTLLTTEQMLEQLRRGDGGSNLAIKVAGALQVTERDLPVDPYVLGYWLGDGSAGAAHLTVGDHDSDAVARLFEQRGYRLEQVGNGLTRRIVDLRWQEALALGLHLVGEGWTISSAARQAGCDTATLGGRAKEAGLQPGTKRLRRGTADALKTRKASRQLADAGVLHDKHIPRTFLRASAEQRLELLRGLVDSDGYVNETGNVVIELMNRTLAEGVLELVRSLGMAPSWRIGKAHLDGKVVGATYAVSFTTDRAVACLPRKAGRLAAQTRYTQDWRYVTAIEPVDSVPVRCIEVDAADHLFLAGEAMVPTHNTTTLLRYLTELTQVSRDITEHDADTDTFKTRTARASILGLDWMRNMRNLATIVDPERFRFYSVSKPEMGEFRWNLLAIPAAGMSASEWLNQMADNMVASWNLGEFGRSLLAEFLGDLYGANRLEDFVLLEAKTDPDTGTLVRDAIVLEPVDRSTLPDGAIQYGPDGREIANVYTCPELSRLVSIEHLAVLVMARVEEMSTPEAAKLYGTAMRDRIQSLWRRISYFAPGGTLTELFGCDETLEDATTLSVSDLIAPDEGLVVIVETDGLDMANRRLILGSVLMAVYRYGLAHGEGIFDHGGQGPGTHIVLEEAHELFGEGGEDADSFSVATRTSLYESLFRRSRALGVRLVAVAQNPGSLPVAVTSNTSTVLVHRCYDTDDRKRVFDLLNWNNQVAQQQREWRWLGEMPVGWCIARMHARTSYLESAPVLVKSDPAPLEQLSDAEMVEMAASRSQPAWS